MALAMLVFIRAIEAFEVPALVGLPGRISVLTTDIYTNMMARAPPDLGGSSALSVLMLVLVLVLLYVYGRLSRHAERFATITGKGFRPRPFDLGRLRYVAAAHPGGQFRAAAGGADGDAGLDLAVAVLRAGERRVVQAPQPQQLSHRAGIRPSRADDQHACWSRSRPRRFAVALTFFAAWLAVRRAPGGWLVERLATIPLVFPGLVLGVAVMQVFLRLPIPLYGTLGILIWAFVINYLPYGMRYSSSGMLQIHRELEEAAAVCGASPLTRLRRIVAPLLAPALVAGWLFIFLMATRVLSLAILLAGPRSQTMAVAMFDLWGNGQGTELAALGLMWSMLMAMIAVVFYVLARRSAARRAWGGHRWVEHDGWRLRVSLVVEASPLLLHSLGKVDALLNPRNVVILGASDTPGNWSQRVWRNVNRYKFPGPGLSAQSAPRPDLGHALLSLLRRAARAARPRGGGHPGGLRARCADRGQPRRRAQRHRAHRRLRRVLRSGRAAPCRPGSRP